jgi:hypothetical protein
LWYCKGVLAVVRSYNSIRTRSISGGWTVQSTERPNPPMQGIMPHSVQHVSMHSYIMQRYSLTFQNCLLASLPPTLFKILAPPGCSSTNPSILYTSLSMMMCKPLSTLPASLTSLAVNSLDMLVDFGREFGSGLLYVSIPM